MHEQGHTQDLENFVHALPVKRETLFRAQEVRLHRVLAGPQALHDAPVRCDPREAPLHP